MLKKKNEGDKSFVKSGSYEEMVSWCQKMSVKKKQKRTKRIDKKNF